MKEYVTVEELADAYVECKTIGHSWDNNPTGVVDSALFRSSIACMMLRCTRCTTERYDYIAKDFTVWKRYYRYPKKYTTVPKQATRLVLRAEMFHRDLLILRRETRKSTSSHSQRSSAKRSSSGQKARAGRGSTTTRSSYAAEG